MGFPIKQLTIPISNTERLPLIISGRNGCGKTSLLETISTSLEYYVNPDEIICYLKANRRLHLHKPYDFKVRFNQISIRFDLKPCFTMEEDARQWLDLGLFNNRHNQMEFERCLKLVFDDPDLRLLPYDEFKCGSPIKSGNGINLNLYDLPSSYSAFLAIVAELFVRMNIEGSHASNMHGTALVDEIEVHLDIELSKRVLPVLMELFPKIKFIITTNSPFVLTSVNKACYYDITSGQIITDNFSIYSCDAIIESYFGFDKYSNHLKLMIKEYENAINHENSESDKLKYFKDYFDNIPTFMAHELDGKLLELKLKLLTKTKRGG